LTANHSQPIREDIRDLTGIVSIGSVETLFSLLPERVGSLLSVTSLAEDLKVACNTVLVAPAWRWLPRLP
jgi:predicted AAA+ superfamily ATPase